MANKENVLVNTSKRIFYLSDNISNETIAQLNFNLIYLLNEDDEKENEQKNYERKPIKIFINSRGGNVYDMWSLIDIMLNSKTPIYTYCTGYAMSAAFEIFLAGSRRFTSNHATFLYHQTNNGMYGKYQDVIDNQEEWEWVQNRIEEYVASRTKITTEMLKYNREHKKDWYIHTTEALHLGIATDNIENKTEV